MSTRVLVESQNSWSRLLADANLALAKDDELTAYADDRKAVLVTHDVEFSSRRARNVAGRHLQLRCEEPDAVDLVTLHFAAIIDNLGSAEQVFVRISAEGCTRSMKWEWSSRLCR